MKKDEIKDSALNIFAKKGYYDTSLEEIADTIGITKPALYYYFKSKSQMYFEILYDNIPVYKEQIQLISDNLKDQSLEQNLKAVFFLFFEFPSENVILIFKRTLFMANYDCNNDMKVKAKELIKVRNDIWFEEIIKIIKNKKTNITDDALKIFLTSFFLFIKGFVDWIYLSEPATKEDIYILADQQWNNFWNGSKIS